MSASFTIVFIVAILLAIITVVATWRIFQKANKPGWAAIVPFYQGWTLAKVGGKPGWWGLIGSLTLTFRLNSNPHTSTGLLAVFGIIGLIAFIFYLMIDISVARNFGKSRWFGVLLALLPFVGYPILAFSDAEYLPK